MSTNEVFMLIKPPNEKPETKNMIRGSMNSHGFKLTN